MPSATAVFFDVDFTLIAPGRRFQAAGYQDTCAKYGISIDPARFDRAVAGSAHLLETETGVYDGRIFEEYTCRIIERMGGGCGPGVEAAAHEIFEEWADYEHFRLYEDVPDALHRIHALGIRIGLISNTHRSLASFESHFGLKGLISATLSSSDHGFMKPHPSIFQAALDLLGVEPAAAAMVGDSLVHDVLGAADAGMRGILLVRGAGPEASTPADSRVTVIRSLEELPGVLEET